MHGLSLSLWVAAVAAASTSTASSCVDHSAAIQNLTVYGVEIVYTDASPSTSATLDTSTTFVFQLYNDVIGVDAQCSVHLPQADTASDEQHSCFVESHDTRIAASFRFDLQGGLLTVNETWQCDEAGGVDWASAPLTAAFEAHSTSRIALLCRETVTALGQHYCAETASLPLPVNVTMSAG